MFFKNTRIYIFKTHNFISTFAERKSKVLLFPRKHVDTLTIACGYHIH